MYKTSKVVGFKRRATREEKITFKTLNNKTSR